MTATIRSLCDETLVEIFSYINTEDLLTSVYDVCDEWAQIISYDSRVWRNRWLVWNVMQPPQLFLKYFKKAPLLHQLKVWSPSSNVYESLPYRNAELKRIIRWFSQIKKLDIHFAVSVDILTFLPHSLLFFAASRISHQDYSILSHFEYIEELLLYHAFDFTGRHLRILADNCTRLKKLHLSDSRSLTSCDVIYFLEKRSDQIECLELDGYGLSDEAFQTLISCKELKQLIVHDSRQMSYPTLSAIVHCRNINLLILSRLKHTIQYTSFENDLRIVLLDNEY